MEALQPTLRDLREAKRIGQSELGRRLGGLSQAYVSTVESGRGSFGRRAQDKWAAALGVDVDEVIKAHQATKAARAHAADPSDGEAA